MYLYNENVNFLDGLAYVDNFLMPEDSGENSENASFMPEVTVNPISMGLWYAGCIHHSGNWIWYVVAPWTTR